MPLTSYYIGPVGGLKLGLDEKEIQAVIDSGEGVLWVDIGDTTEADHQFLRRVFKFHPVAVDACLDSRIHTPKVDDFGDYLFLVLHGINYGVKSDTVETGELDLFLGRNFLVSNHNFFLLSVDGITKSVKEDGRPLRRGVEFLAHALIEALVINLEPTIDRLGDMADDIETEIFLRPQSPALEATLRLKRSCLRLLHAIVPQREVLGLLNPRELEQVSPEAEVFYRDVHNRLSRIEGSVQNLRERTDTILSIYLSAMANQQNESIRTLSLIAAVFLPLTLLASIYGMNFQYMPGLAWRWGYYAVLGFMGSVALVTIAWFWSRHWASSAGRGTARLAPLAAYREEVTDDVRRLLRWPSSSGQKDQD